MQQVQVLFSLCLLCALLQTSQAFWLTKEVAGSIIKEFKDMEDKRAEKPGRGHDRRPATPFVSGDAFRELCSPHICEDANRCRMTPEDVKDGQCIFIKADMFDMFLTHVAPRVTGKYVIVTHNGDLSTPDGQTDAPRIGMGKYEGLPRLLAEYKAGRLLAHHGQNLWWRNITIGEPRPNILHCLPIGIEIRQYKVGGNPSAYTDTLQRFIDAPSQTMEQLSKRPLLLVAFYPKSRVPDRHKVMSIIGALQKPQPPNPWYNYTDLDHQQWLDGINHHKFVLAPFGHGLDTHRVYEILLMGGIPVMRRSSISSCFDDSDNDMGSGAPRRGSLPVVILDRWEDLNATRLDAEWDRIKKIPLGHWDHTRLLFQHWAQRIKSLTHRFQA